MEVAPYGHDPNYVGARAPDGRKMPPPSAGSKRTPKKLKQQSTRWRRRAGSAEGLQGVTEVTTYALLFGLAGWRRQAALDCRTAPPGQKDNKKLQKQQSTNERGRVGAAVGRVGRYIVTKN